MDVKRKPNEIGATYRPGGAITEEAVDAQSTLAAGYIAALSNIGEDALQAIVFIRLYAPAHLAETIISTILDLKLSQQPGAAGGMLKAIESMALHKFLSKIQLNLGGK